MIKFNYIQRVWRRGVLCLRVAPLLGTQLVFQDSHDINLIGLVRMTFKNFRIPRNSLI